MDYNNEEAQLASDSKQHRVERDTGTRKPYTSPQLEVLGDVRDITLGGTPGSGDSGGGAGVENPPR